MEEHLRKTKTIVNQFLHNELSFSDCISALDAGLASVIPRMRREDIPELRAVMFANNEIVIEQMARRNASTPE